MVLIIWLVIFAAMVNLIDMRLFLNILRSSKTK